MTMAAHHQQDEQAKGYKYPEGPQKLTHDT